MTAEPPTVRCIVVSPNHSLDVQDVDAPAREIVHTHGTVLYVRLPALFEADALDFTLDSLLGDRTAEADTVLIKCHAAVFADISQSAKVMNRLESRFPQAKVRLLHWAAASHEVVSVPSLDRDPDLGPDLVGIARDVDFLVGMGEPGATLPSNPEFHYEGPNGLHYDQFVRAGHAFQSVDAIEGAAFWLLPYFHKLDLVLLDSWTMLAFGHGVAAYCAREAPGRTPRPPVIECAEEYVEGPRLQQRLSAIAALTTGHLRTLIVTSVHSTGATERALLDVCASAGAQVSRIVRLFGNGDAELTPGKPVTTMHHLTSPVNSSPAGVCRSCLQQRKSVVPIDKRSLLLALTAAVEEARITVGRAEGPRAFLAAYGSTGCVSVHRSQPGGGRHHMIYIDVERLLSSGTFSKKVKVAAEGFRGHADVVLCPTHPAAIGIGQVVAGTLGVRLVIAEQKAYANLEGQDLQALQQAEHILFVDDVAITGSRMRRVKSSLMHARIITDRRDAEVNVLVGVARPAETRAWSGVLDMVGRKNFVAVESIELPNWDQRQCPWCSELGHLQEYQQTRTISDLLLVRLQRLQNTADGLTGDLFLPSATDAGGRVRRIAQDEVGESAFEAAKAALDKKALRAFAFSDLGQGSIFGQLKEAELFVAVAASLQALRNAGELSERTQYPLSRVLDPHLYFLGRFYANIIVACVLRAARRRDIRTVDIEPVLRRACGERLVEPESLELHAELFLAMAEGRLPIPEEVSDNRSFDGMHPSIRDFALWLASRKSI
jgi:hypothetical protein